MGERTPVALLDAPASGRLAVAEAITNIAGGRRRLARATSAVGQLDGRRAATPARTRRSTRRCARSASELCPALGIAIPVGKDSLSMRTAWSEGGSERCVIAPVSLIVSAFAPVADVRRTLTPELQLDERPDLAVAHRPVGADATASAARRSRRCTASSATQPPDLDDPQRWLRSSRRIAELRAAGLLLAYHDRSDGGLFVTLLEMAFAGHCGLDVALPAARGPALARCSPRSWARWCRSWRAMRHAFLEILARHGLDGAALYLGAPVSELRVQLSGRHGRCSTSRWAELQRAWSETTWRMRRLRDDPACADEEYAAHTRRADPGLSRRAQLRSRTRTSRRPYIARGARPRVAILREQGVNGQVEMAAAFDRAGFEPHDVHMTDLLAGGASSREFRGLVACGGFSYGDVLGAGEGWAKSILFHARARARVRRRSSPAPDTFALGVCNGCQMFAALRESSRATAHWPRFVRNRSEQFEARFALVEVLPSPSVLLAGMGGSRLPIAVAHGEGRAEFSSAAAAAACAASGLVGLRYVSHDGSPAASYPANPSGSPHGIAALCNADGRVTIIMPHPERSFRYLQNSWRPRGAGEYSGWMRMFRNARRFVD